MWSPKYTHERPSFLCDTFSCFLMKQSIQAFFKKENKFAFLCNIALVLVHCWKRCGNPVLWSPTAQNHLNGWESTGAFLFQLEQRRETRQMIWTLIHTARKVIKIGASSHHRWSLDIIGHAQPGDPTTHSCALIDCNGCERGQGRNYPRKRG